MLHPVEVEAQQQFGFVVVGVSSDASLDVGHCLLVASEHVQTLRTLLKKIESVGIYHEGIREVCQSLLEVAVLAVNDGLHEVVLRNIVFRFVDCLENEVELRLLPSEQQHCVVEVEQRIVRAYGFAEPQFLKCELGQSSPSQRKVVFLHEVDCAVEVGLHPVVQEVLGFFELGGCLSVLLVVVVDNALTQALVIEKGRCLAVRRRHSIVVLQSHLVFLVAEVRIAQVEVHALYQQRAVAVLLVVGAAYRLGNALQLFNGVLVALFDTVHDAFHE